ncbi:unnamed protein product [Penicillium pancosmium]
MDTIDEIAQLERELGQQRVENAYYRDCYALFKLLQDLAENTSHDLQRLYNSDSPNDPRSSSQEILWSLQNTIFSMIEKACEYADAEASYGVHQPTKDIGLKPWQSRK